MSKKKHPNEVAEALLPRRRHTYYVEIEDGVTEIFWLGEDMVKYKSILPEDGENKHYRMDDL